MKRSTLILLSAVALTMNACEQHPLPGQPPVKEEHEGASHAEPHAAAHEETAKPAAEHAAEKK